MKQNLSKSTLNVERHQELIALFWELNYQHFSGILPAIELRFTGRLQTTGGQYFTKPSKKIQISSRYFDMADPWDEIRDTLGHEMVHYWLDFQGKPCGHTAMFRKKLRDCGFERYSRLAPVKAKYVYFCPACTEEYPRRKKGVWSCGSCSGKRFNPAYRLILKDGKKHEEKNNISGKLIHALRTLF